MHQVYTETIIREIDDDTTPLWRKVSKAVFKKYEHGYPLNEYEGMQVFIKETMAEA